MKPLLQQFQLALFSVLMSSLAACGSDTTSDGLLSDNLVCHTAIDSIEEAVTAIDADNSGQETSVPIGGAATGVYQPAVAQYFTPDQEQNIWAVAVKLVAPAGAGGDINLAIIDNNIEITSSPLVYASKRIPAEKIGYVPTWLLVDFGDFATVQAGTTYRLALTATYGQAESRVVSWVTVPGTGLEQLNAPTATETASLSRLPLAGVYLLEDCQ